jgi:anti-anti-sigma regulatory factor
MDARKLHIPIPFELEINTINQINLEALWKARISPLNEIVFDFSGLEFVRPSGLVAIVALMKFSKHLKIADRYYLRESKNYEVRQYLKRMGFYDQFGIIRENPAPKTKSNFSLCELREVISESEADKVTEQLANIIKEQIQPERNMINAISHALGEVINNVFHHSNSPVNGFVCAQTYKILKKVEIAIADCGIGIKESLWGNPMYKFILDDFEAIKTALGKKVTSKPHENAGEGLFVCQRFIKENSGQMDIISGNAHYTLLNNEVFNKKHQYWQGTIVSLVFNIDKPVDPKKIFDSEFPIDAEFDDLF